MQSVSQELIRVALMILLVGNVFAVLVGVFLITAPQRLAKWSRLPNRWVSTEAVIKPLEQMRDVDRYAFRHPRLLGVLLLAGAAFILFQGTPLVWRISIADGGRLLADVFGNGSMPSALWEALWLSLIALLVLGIVLTLTVALLGLFSPGVLARLHAKANRWVSTQRSSEALDAPHYALDDIIRHRPRVWGGAIVLLAVYTLVNLLWLLRAS